MIAYCSYSFIVLGKNELATALIGPAQIAMTKSLVVYSGAGGDREYSISPVT